MSTDLLTHLREAEALEKSGDNAKTTEAAFDRFILSYENQEVEVKEQFQKQLPFVYNSRGLARYLQVEFELAIEDFSKAIELNASVANFYYNRGLIEFRLKDFGSARVDLLKTLQLDPAHDSAKKCLDTMDAMINQGNY